MKNLYYIQINALCLAVLLVVAVLMHGKRENSPARRRVFLSLVSATAIICISDIFSWLCDGRPDSANYFVLMASNIIYDGAITAACFIWLSYVRLRVEGIEKYSRRFKHLSAIPLAVMIIVLLTTPFTGFLFKFDEGNNYVRGDGIFLHWIISWGYLFAAAAIVIRRFVQSESAIEKRQLTPLIWFIVPPVIAAVLQMIFFGITTMQCGMTLSVIIIAFSTMQEKVFTDALTDMNNRNAFDNYINDRLNHMDYRFTLLMCDVDHFKTINDTLGHIVGDIVLKRMSGILKSVCAESRSRLFLCRYGGDEFIICSTDADAEEVARIRQSISDKLFELNQEYPVQIKLSMSIGCADGVCDSVKDVEALVRAADEQMYTEKRARESVSIT